MKKFQNLFSKTQDDRSMVEMLGVLAIIGVLSVGGIAGFNMAMLRYRTNELLDAINKLVIETEHRAQATNNEEPFAGYEDSFGKLPSEALPNVIHNYGGGEWLEVYKNYDDCYSVSIRGITDADICTTAVSIAGEDIINIIYCNEENDVDILYGNCTD